MEHENDSKTNCNWCAQYSHQRIGSGTGGFGNKMTSKDHPNYSIVEIAQNTKSPGDERRLVGTKNSQKSKNNYFSLKKEMESLIMVAQNNALRTDDSKTNTDNTQENTLCYD